MRLSKTLSTAWRERGLLAACIALALAAFFAPALNQPAGYHAFADHGTWLGVPHAGDVLSNQPFALFGLAGFWLFWRLPSRTMGNGHRATLNLLFAGLVLTALGSTAYHWRPDDAGLVLDRLGMAMALAGVVGLAAAERVSGRAAGFVAVGALVAGALAVHAWQATGNLTPWVVCQAGGAVLIAGLACMREVPGALQVRWLPVLLAYGLAKAFEASDHAVHEFTAHAISGHTLKHLAAALAVLPVLWAMPRRPMVGGLSNACRMHA